MIIQITEYLEAQLSLTMGQDLFIGFMPDKPSDCTTLYQYQGERPGIEMGTGQVVEEKIAIQLVFRGENYEEVSNRAQSAFYSLCSEDNEFHIVPQQSPFSLGKVFSKWKFVFNVRVVK